MAPDPWQRGRQHANGVDDAADAVKRGSSAGSAPAPPLQRLPGGAMGCPLCGPTDQRELRERETRTDGGRGPARTDGGRPGGSAGSGGSGGGSAARSQLDVDEPSDPGGGGVG